MKQKQVTAKPAMKPVSTPAVHRTRTRTAALKKLFMLSAMSRPVSGHRLYAHTYAAFTVLGMLVKGRPFVKREAVVAYIGDRAVGYHIDKTLSLEEHGDKLRLTTDGIARFRERIESGKVKQEEIDAYVGVFTSGKPDDSVCVKASHIVDAPVAM